MKYPRRRSLFAVAFVLLILGGVPGVAHAEWHLTPLFGFTFKGDTTLVNETTEADGDDLRSVSAASKVHWNFGGAVTLIGAGPLGVEAIFLYTPGFLQQDLDLIRESRTTALMGNVVLAAPRNWNEYGLRPYVSGGLGLLRVSGKDVLTQVDLFAKPVSLFGYNVGGGAVGFLSDRTGLRFDLRYFSEVRPRNDPEIPSFGPIELSYWNLAVGLVFRY